MGRYTGPVCKLCRRERMKLFLKGARCQMAKCPIDTGRAPPGMHGARRGKLSEYATQLREKQRLRRSYGLQEGQFRLFFQRALRMKGVTSENLLRLLELRLDNTIYRLGFAPSRRAARQFVRHGHVLVNGRRVDIPSVVLKPGDVVEVGRRPSSRKYAEQFVELAESRGVVPWLRVDRKAFRGEVLYEPKRDEMPVTFNEQLVVELYSK
ncbi:MAG TPA: 30S ribosomal protein S4 [Kiritimatiellae bacterium]|nr:30S ribosomal protein S4 [Kiritimatiellia bacterium]